MYRELNLGKGEELGKILQKGGILKTQRLLNDYYLLSNENLNVLVDALRPRILGIFSCGKFGTFQQLLYDTPWDEAMGVGKWGIFPSAQIGVLGDIATFYPFKISDKPNDPNLGKETILDKPKEVIFPRDGNALTIKGLTYQRKDGGEKLPAEELYIELKGDKIILRVKYPIEPRITEVRTLWYPLYRTHIEEDQPLSHINYFEGYSTILGNETLLTDTQGRMPRIRLKSKYQRWEIEAGQDKKRHGAFRLEVIARGRTKEDEIEIEVLENPVTIAVNPYLMAGKEEKLLFLSEEPVKAKVDGEEIKISSSERGQEASVLLKKGEHIIEAENEKGRSKRRIFAIGDLAETLKPVGELILKMQYKELPLKGVFPYSYHIDTLKLRINHWGEELAGCASYGIRVGYFLSAAIMLYNDDRYKKALLDLFEGFERLNHVFDDGGILIGADYQLSGKSAHHNRSGKYGPDSINICRAINQLESIRAGLMGYTAFKKIGEEKNAEKCLEYAARCSLPLFKMQDKFPDGRMHWWYMYWSLQPASDDPDRFMQRPLGISALELADVLEKEKIKTVVTADRLKDFVKRQVDFLDKLPPERLSTIAGAEATANSMSTRVGAAIGEIIRGIIKPEKREEHFRKAKEFGILALLSTQAYPYAPQFYLQQACTAASAFLLFLAQGYKAGEGLSGLSSKGDMDDNTGPLGLMFKKYLNEELGELLIDYTLAHRMATSIFDNGAICECEVDVPGKYFKKDDYTYLDVNCAYIGMLAFYKASGEVIT